MKAKVAIVPVYQKHWLFYVWTESTAAENALERTIPWQQGASLQEKATLFGKEIGHRISAAAQRQWKSLQVADEGGFKNRLYRLAQWVLSKEDPRETFLKSIPLDATQLEVFHPSSLQERLVRRRLRRMAQAQEAFHNRRILGWALATLPQLPLVITPLPNVTLYFTAYKMVSHYQALQGCRALRSAFDHYDQVERDRVIRAAITPDGDRGRARSGGGLLGRLPLPLPWRRGGAAGTSANPTQLAAAAAVASSLAGSEAASRATGASAPVLFFRPSQELDKAVVPLERWLSPLTDEMAVRVKDVLSSAPHPRAKAKAAAAKHDADGSGTVHAGVAKSAGQATAQPGGADLPGGKGGDGSGSSAVDSLPELVTRLRNQVLEKAGGAAGEPGVNAAKADASTCKTDEKTKL